MSPAVLHAVGGEGAALAAGSAVGSFPAASGAVVAAGAALGGAAIGALLTPWLRRTWLPKLPRWLLPALTAVVWVILTRQLTSATPALLVVATGTVLVTVVDLGLHRLPTGPIRITTCLALLALLAAGLLADEAQVGWAQVAWSIGGGLGYPGFLACLRAIKLRGGAPVGIGDVRLAVPLGLTAGWCGPMALLVAIAGAFVAGGLVACGLLATGRAKATDRIPFGPAMALGWLAAVAVDWSQLT